MTLEAAHEARRKLEQQAVPQLAVLERTGVEGHCAVLEEGLDFGHEELQARISCLS